MTLEEFRAPVNQPCHYCGRVVTGKHLHRDHYIPKCLGGSNDIANLVYSCRGCNSVKGKRLFENARLDLVMRRLGWPRFTMEQLEWLGGQKFDLSPLGSAQLHFEANPQ